MEEEVEVTLKKGEDEYKAAVRSLGATRYEVEIQGQLIEVEVSAGGRAGGRGGGGKAKAKGPIELLAPIPGRVLEVRVADGDKVEEGQVLLVLEAMKMENEITSPRDGVISELSVEPDQLVEMDQKLLIVGE